MDGNLVIDVHSHFMPEEATKNRTTSDGINFVAIMQGRRSLQIMDIENRLQTMDEAGIDMTVLSNSAESPQGIAMCRQINDGYARIERKYPKRFISCTHIPLEGSAQAIHELERTVGEYGFKSVALLSSTLKMTPDSDELFPLYKKISELDMPILIHPSIRIPLWGGAKYNMSKHISREYDIIKATIEVMYGVLKAFPDLKFVIPHHGGGMPNLKGRIMSNFEPDHHSIPEELCGLPKTPRELKELGIDKVFKQTFDKLYFDTAGFGGWMPITESATKVIRTDRICFGTDYPFEIHTAKDIKSFIKGIRNLDISETAKSNILGGNIKRLLKI